MIFISLILIYFSQLRPYHAAAIATAAARTDAPAAVNTAPHRPTARDILRLNRHPHRLTPQQSAEIEGNAYLHDDRPATGSLLFWQACGIFFS